MKTIPLCQICHCPVDELTYHMEGKQAKHCIRCGTDYVEKSEPIPEGLRIWEENVLGEKRNVHVWWSGHKSDECDHGLFVNPNNYYYDRSKTAPEKQCVFCADMYAHGILDNPVKHPSGAWVYGKAHHVWMPDCNASCRAGMEMWSYNRQTHYTQCKKCRRRFQEWVFEHDQEHIKYLLASLNDRTEYTEKKNKKTGANEIILGRKAQTKTTLRMQYQFQDGYQTSLLFYEWHKDGEWQHTFAYHTDAEEYILEKTNKKIRNFWM